jgi:hypothetical protein
MGIECYVVADFAGGWNITSSANTDNVMPCTGFVITYANCPIYWASPEAEYIAMSYALCKVISLMTLMKELHTIFPVT